MNAQSNNQRRTSRLLAVVAVLVPIATTHAGESWPTFRGRPTQTGVAAGELPRELSVRWKYKCGDVVTSTAAIADSVVYVGSDDEHLHAIDLKTGASKWKYNAGEFLQAPPAVYEGFVLVGDDLGIMHAVHTDTGKRAWTFATNSQITSSVNYAQGKIVFGSYDGFIYCLNPRTGQLIWKKETQGRVHGTPAVTPKGQVIAAGCDEFLHVLDLANGRSVREVSMNSVSGASACIVGPRAYVGTYGNQVRAVDWTTGQTVWTFEDPDRQFPFMSSAAATKTVVVIGGRDKRLRALAADTGQLIWEFAAKSRIDSSPVIVGDRVFVGSDGGILHAVILGTGKPVWKFETGASITASPAVADGCLVIASTDGIVYCFAAKSRK